MRPEAVWDETLFESAKSSLIFEIIEREKSIGDVVSQALLNSFKGVPSIYNQQLVQVCSEPTRSIRNLRILFFFVNLYVFFQSINSVTVDDLRAVGDKYIRQLFSTAAKTAIVCHPDKSAQIATAFEQFGIKLQVESSLEESCLGKLAI